jgi:hypothetical protein
MALISTLTALLVAVVNGGAAAWAGWRWYTVEPDRLSWVLVRTGQGAAVVLALVAGVAFVSGARPDDGLFWLYALLPAVIGFFAEQFRLISAQTVLDARGLPDAKAMAGLPDAEQRSIVLQIVRRELGVMVVAAAVVCFLALRAAGQTGGL